MLVLQIHRPEVEVLSSRNAQGDPIKVIVLIDPATGIQIHAPLPEPRANELGKVLQGTAVQTYTPSEMPAAKTAAKR